MLITAVNRDLIYKQDYNSDLRNRVVGARLIQDGKSPYFYKWKTSDGTRYYDPGGFSDAKASVITSSPFFNTLLIPICNYTESAIANIWLCLEYILFATIVLIAISFCKDPVTKFAVIVIALAFLFTDAWKYHVSIGEMYIIIPFLLSVFTYLLYRAQTNTIYFICGVLAISMVLIKPNFIVFFLPLLLLLKGLSIKKIVALFAPAGIAFILICSNSFERQLWSDYFAAIKIHIQVHQGEPYEKIAYEQDPKYAEWEGISMKASNFLKPEMSITPKSENGNFFVIFRMLTHKKISTMALLTASGSLIIALFAFFYIKSKKILVNKTDIKYLVLLGFCFYMITDLFSPVYRHQYYTLQWMFAVLLFFSISSKKYFFSILVATGVFLNMINTDEIKMEHTIGEYLILFSLIIFSFAYFKQRQLEN